MSKGTQYLTSFDSGRTLDVEKRPDGSVHKLLINQLEVGADRLSVVKLNHSLFHLILDHQSIEVEVLGYDEETTKFRYKVNGKELALSAKSKLQLQIEKMGLGTGASSKANDIKAPMPGLIVGVHVDVGQAVKKGDTLLVLEAMKMENAIKAAGDGVVKKVSVSTGDKVDKGQILVKFG